MFSFFLFLAFSAKKLRHARHCRQRRADRKDLEAFLKVRVYLHHTLGPGPNNKVLAHTEQHFRLHIEMLRLPLSAGVHRASGRASAIVQRRS